MKTLPQFLFLSIMILGLIHVAAIRKADDPVTDTQTNPILYNEKMEQMKDGEKAAPAPKHEHYKKELFLQDPPYQKEDVTQEGNQDRLTYIPTPDEHSQDMTTEASGISEDDEWWFDEHENDSLLNEGEELQEDNSLPAVVQ